MKWEDYYDKFWDWAESTRISRISSITDFASAAEVVEAAEELFDEVPASRLVKRAIEEGVKFSPEQIVQLAETVDEETVRLAVENRKGNFTSKQKEALEELYFDIFEEEENNGQESVWNMPFSAPNTKPGLFSLLFGSWGNNENREHHGVCTGDCANCPAHYGYRYGRWYYGHHHSHGCEFGGNDGSGRP